MTRIVTFVNALLAALLVGAMFGIWLRGSPADLSPSAYVRQQQQDIRALNETMPRLGGVTVLLTLAAAALSRHDRGRLALLGAASVCLLLAGGVTRFLNQPINATVMTWSPDAPPADWAGLRDEWWQWHVVRTALGVGGLALLLAAGLILGNRPLSFEHRPRSRTR